MRSIPLHQFYYGKWWEGNQERSDFIVTACSAGLQDREARQLYIRANLGSDNRVSDLGGLKHAYGLLKADDDTYLLLHVRPGPIKARGHVYPDYRCIVIPRPVIVKLAGNLKLLLEGGEDGLLDNDAHLPKLSPGLRELPKLQLEEPIQSLPAQRESELLQFLDKEFENSCHLVPLLSALITGKPVAIVDAPSDPNSWRWDLSQAIMFTLPPIFRHHLTFATEVFDSTACLALLKFLYKDPRVRSGKEDIRFSWKHKTFRPEPSPHSYAEFIDKYWSKGPLWLAELINSEHISALADLCKNKSLADALSVLADKMELTQKINEKTVKEEDLPLLERAIGMELKLAGQAPTLVNGLQKTMLQLTEQGFGYEMYKLLWNWLRQSAYIWGKNTLQQIVFTHLKHPSHFETEGNLLDFINNVRDSSNYFEPQFWTQFITALQPASQQYASVTVRLISLSLDYDLDYKLILIDKSDRKWPSELEPIVNQFLNPSCRYVSSSGALVTASRILPRHQDQFFIILSELTILQDCLHLIDKDALQHLGLLINDDRYQHRVFTIVNELYDQLESLDSQVLLDLAKLCVAQAEQDKHFWSAIMREVYLGILNRSDLPVTDDLKGICWQVTSDVLKMQASWPEKAAILAEMASSYTLQTEQELRQQMIEAINDHARENISSLEELRNMNDAFDQYPPLQNESRLRILMMLGEALGSQKLADFEQKLTITMLANLKRIDLLNWAHIEQEVLKQVQDFLPEAQENFRRNCLELASLIAPGQSPEAPSQSLNETIGVQDSVNAFKTLINALDILNQRLLRPAPVVLSSPMPQYLSQETYMRFEEQAQQSESLFEKFGTLWFVIICFLVFLVICLVLVFFLGGFD